MAVPRTAFRHALASLYDWLDTQMGTNISSDELAVLDGASAANSGTGKALITGTSGAVTIAGAMTFNADPVIGAAKTINLDSEAKTLSSNAVTAAKYAIVLTTESLTTAHTASQALVVTLAGVASGDFAIVTFVGGTNTGGVPVPRAVCTTNTVTINLLNAAIATNAFNGTFIFNVLVFRA